VTTSPDPERAQSFRSIGELYHRLRPSYPDQAVDWMLLADQGRSPARVLDLGAGSGKLTDSLAARGLDVVAVDPSRQMLDVLAERLPAVEVHEGGAEELPLPAQSVDAVVVGQAWHWMDPTASGAELARVLRTGGSVAMARNADLAVEDWPAGLIVPPSRGSGSGRGSARRAIDWDRTVPASQEPPCPTPCPRPTSRQAPPTAPCSTSSAASSPASPTPRARS